MDTPQNVSKLLLLAGLALGLLGDALLRAGGPPGLNLTLWITAIVVAAFALQRETRVELDSARAAWLLLTALFAAGLAWRDAPPLKLLALASVSISFALAGYRLAAGWVREAGITRYVRAWGAGALHAWTASALVLLEAGRSIPRADEGTGEGWRRAAAVARGLVLATPPMVVFGALFMSADAVFATLVIDLVRFDVEVVASHIVLFGICAWLSTGYLRGFLAGTELPPLGAFWRESTPLALAQRRPSLSILEIGSALAAIDLLFLAFVAVQLRYLFGGDALVQVTPDLTYAEYARRGFFELVAATALVVPMLLAADWLLGRRGHRDDLIFRILAGVQIALVLAIATSALQRLRLYYDSYGLTGERFYAGVLLVWMGAMLIWLAATVLRGRRHRFAFGALVSALATAAVLFAVNPDAIVARTNLARVAAAERTGAVVSFDASYASTLSADAVPVLIEGMQALPADMQCTLADWMLRRWSPGAERPWRSWNWSNARAYDAVRANAAALRAACS